MLVSTQIAIDNVTLNRLALSVFSPPWSVTRSPLTQQQAHSAMVQDTLFHGKTFFVVSTPGSDYITLSGFTQSISSNFCHHVLLIENTKLLYSLSI